MATFLTKDELVQRVALRLGLYGIDSGNRTAVQWAESHIDEWIDSSLAFAGDPGPNNGRVRTYVYAFRHYQRILLLLAMYGEGRKASAELHIQLFLRSHSNFSQALRDAVLSEYQKFRSQLISTLRSKQFTNLGPVTEARQRQIIKSAGPLDERLRAFQLPPKFYIDIARLAREQDPDARDHRQSFSKPALFQFLRPIFSGMLDEGGESEPETKTEKLIRLSDRDAYERARRILGFIHASTQLKIPFLAEAFRTLRIALRQREFSSFLVVLALRLGSGPI